MNDKGMMSDKELPAQNQAVLQHVSPRFLHVKSGL